MIIYKTINLINGKIYVGQNIYDNPKYLGSGVCIINAIKKYGKESFVKEIIDFAESLDVLNDKEKYWIKFYNCKRPNGYNLTDGGGGTLGCISTEETKKKMSESKKGKPLSEEHKKKMSESFLGEKNPMFGKPKSEETKKKMSESLKGNPKSEETRKKISESLLGEKHPMFGKHHSEKTKKKMSESLKGIVPWNKGLKEVHKHTDETEKQNK